MCVDKFVNLSTSYVFKGPLIMDNGICCLFAFFSTNNTSQIFQDCRHSIFSLFYIILKAILVLKNQLQAPVQSMI